MSSKGLQLLTQAMQAGATAALISGPETAGEKLMLRLIRSPDDATPAGVIHADLEKGRPALADALVAAATSVRVMARVAWAEITFPTTVLSHQRRLLKRRITLQMPEAQQISVQQRRRTPREKVPHAVRVQARIARCDNRAQRIDLPVDVLDLSWTGIRVCCRAEDVPAGLHSGELIAVTLSHHSTEQILTARYRNLERAASGGVRLGLEFDPPPPTTTPATAPLCALIQVLAELRVRHATEQVTARSLGLAG